MHEENTTIIDEQDAPVRLNALTPKEWQPLFALIPEIEKSTVFEECTDKACYPAPIVYQFLEAVYTIPIMIAFDWVHWDKGRKIARNPDFDFNTLDLVTKCKLITAIVRSDRFSEGALVAAFESGLILKILKSIEKEVTTKNYTSI